MPAIEIKSFGPRVYEALRTATYELDRELTDAELEGPEIHVTGARCARCALTVAFEWKGPLAFLSVAKFTHRLEWKTGKQCGGRLIFLPD